MNGPGREIGLILFLGFPSVNRVATVEYPPMLQSEPSKSLINRLGDRLRKGDVSEDDRRLLNNFRQSFREAYETVVEQIRTQLNLEPTGRPAKTTKAIVEKLRREKTRLNQMQDIAGCRLITPTLKEQDRVVAQLTEMFTTELPVDRRARPSHGYRAVHIIVNQANKLVEVQVRTLLQHTWADLSEKLADEFGHEIKYGGGSEAISTYLSNLSNATFDYEKASASGDLDKMLIHMDHMITIAAQHGPLVKSERAKR